MFLPCSIKNAVAHVGWPAKLDASEGVGGENAVILCAASTLFLCYTWEIVGGAGAAITLGNMAEEVERLQEGAATPSTSTCYKDNKASAPQPPPSVEKRLAEERSRWHSLALERL